MSAFYPSAPRVLVAGAQRVTGDVFERIGTGTFDAGKSTLSVTLSTSDAAAAAEVQLTDSGGVPVPGSLLSSTSTKPEELAVTFLIPASDMYDLELRNVKTTETGLCTAADVELVG